MKTIEFTLLEKKLGRKGFWREALGPAPGKVSVVTISRDGCPGCVKIKPVLAAVEKTLAPRGKVSLTTIHIAYKPGDAAESLRSKRLLGHYFYPCTIILIRTRDLGAMEYYRCGSPTAADLKKHINLALSAAGMLK